MGLLMILYPMTRWPIEALRADEPAVFAGMTWSQNISVALLGGGLAVWVGLGRRRHAPCTETPQQLQRTL
jgi:hypothetical protein